MAAIAAIFLPPELWANACVSMQKKMVGYTPTIQERKTHYS
jgi:hypothetical protein